MVDSAATCGPNETPLNWNQSGSAATSGTVTLAQDNTVHTLTTLYNGVTVEAECDTSGVVVDLATLSVTQLSGTANIYTGTVDIDSSSPLVFPFAAFDGVVDASLMVRGSATTTFAHLDLHSEQTHSSGSNGPCTFWWMVMPSS